MSKTYYTSGTGAQQTLANAQDEKIPIYENEAALDADMSNLKVGQIVGTKSGHDDVIDQMKAYIRDQNELSDWETITLSTDVNNPTLIQYDGFISISDYYTGNEGYTSVYIDGVRLVNQNQYGASGSGDNQPTGFTFPVKKGQSVYVKESRVNTANRKGCFYKKRDYSNRQ